MESPHLCLLAEGLGYIESLHEMVRNGKIQGPRIPDARIAALCLQFHHDIVVRIPGSQDELPGTILVVATNCNGGVKEVLCFSEVPDRLALWHMRCPRNPEFSGSLPKLLASATTPHWFDPCELLLPDARSEYREEFRERQCGGGWIPRK